LILEIGADHPGDISSIAKWLPVDVIVFTKGSQSMRMEKAVKMIMEEKSRAKELLVRQEKEREKR